MLTRRTVRQPHAAPFRGARLRRTLPVLALGVTALGLALPTAVTASASPGAPASGSKDAAKVSTPAAPGGTVGGKHLTAAAEAAGLKVGNATMGWRERGTERVQLQQRAGQLRFGAAQARSSSSSSTPKGVLGVDVSSYQGNIKWSTWTKKDKDFAYVKATEGSSYKNPYFKKQYKGAAGAGMMRGAYHFANPSGKWGSTQARYFVKHGGDWSADGHTLPGVLDIEYNPYGATCYGVSKKDMVRWITSFLNEYKKLTGKAAVIYTTTDWWKQCTGNSDRYAKRNPLWIARYGTTKPGTLPKGWKAATFWQYTSSPIDQDVFGNRMKRLRVLATTI